MVRALATGWVTNGFVCYAKELGFYAEENRKPLRCFTCLKIILETVWRMNWQWVKDWYVVSALVYVANRIRQK